MSEEIIVPRIVFDVSWIYDRIWEKVYKITFPKDDYRYPSEEEIEAWAKEMEAFWNKRKKGILEELALISHLRWKKLEITCFVVGTRKFIIDTDDKQETISFTNFAQPLTMRIRDYQKSPDTFLTLLVHELIHNLWDENKNIYGKDWIGDYLDRKYPSESGYVRNHILVYALQAYIHNKFIDSEIDKIAPAKDRKKNNNPYVKAWEIVKTEGYENIIQDFVRHVEEKKRSNP